MNDTILHKDGILIANWKTYRRRIGSQKSARNWNEI